MKGSGIVNVGAVEEVMVRGFVAWVEVVGRGGFDREVGAGGLVVGRGLDGGVGFAGELVGLFWVVSISIIWGGEKVMSVVETE